MNREAQSVVVVLVGSALLRISLTDVHLRYVRPQMQPYLVVAGAALVLLGLWTVFVEAVLHRGAAAESLESGQSRGTVSGNDGHEDEDEDADGHGHGGLRAAWLLLLPVLVIFLVAPPALGSYAASHSASRAPVLPTSLHLAELPPGDPVPLSLTDYVTRAAWDSGRTLAARRVSVDGFVTPGRNGDWYLSRMVISCCAADSYPVSVAVLDAGAAPAADTWLTVTGRFVPGTDDQELPSIRAESVQPIAAPRDPYES